MDDHSSTPPPPPPPVDLSTYPQKYQGHALFSRLLHVASRCPSLSTQTHDLLASHLKNSSNTKLYCDVFANKDTSSSSLEFDKAWVDETERQNHLRLERLEADFSSAKASMIKEAIRIAYNDLGHHYIEVGNLQEAFRAFSRTRDYTSMPRHIEDMVINVCTLAIYLQRTHVLSTYLSPSIEDNASSPLVKAKLRAMTALFSLDSHDYAGAARQFSSIENHIIGNFGSVLSGEDIALGAVICGIAALDRVELRNLLLENPRFKCILDLDSVLRQFLELFLTGRYAQVKNMMSNEVRVRVELDLHLRSHMDKLFSIIQDKLVLQYFQPYNAIRMSRAVDDLFPTAGTSEERASQELELETHVWGLIESHQLQARIDAGCEEGSTLRRVSPDQRAVALQAVWQLSQDSSTKIQQSILRLSLLKNSFALSGDSFELRGGLGYGGMVDSDEEGGTMEVYDA